MTARPCVVCGGPIPTDMRVSTSCCSHKCRDQKFREHAQLMRDAKSRLETDNGTLPREEPSPWAWDGATIYSDRPQTYLYQLVCMLCARARGQEVLLTREQARYVALERHRRCDVCQGPMLLEESDVTGLHSPTRGRVKVNAA